MYLNASEDYEWVDDPQKREALVTNVEITRLMGVPSNPTTEVELVSLMNDQLARLARIIESADNPEPWKKMRDLTIQNAQCAALTLAQFKGA